MYSNGALSNVFSSRFLKIDYERNEICGPLYYTFANDPDIEWRRHAEADCFFCFINLMGLEGVRDNFVQVLDDTQWGIGSNMKRLFELIKAKDASVYNQLEKQNLKPEYFAFRWISLLLSQEFSMPGSNFFYSFFFYF
jgi:TBC1 domain family member 13